MMAPLTPLTPSKKNASRIEPFSSVRIDLGAGSRGVGGADGARGVGVALGKRRRI